jgi:hypothetical protein
MSDDDIDFQVHLDHRTGRYNVTAKRNGQAGWALHKDLDQAKHKATQRLHYSEMLVAEEKRRNEAWEQVKHLPLTQRLAAWEELLGYKVGSR